MGSFKDGNQIRVQVRAPSTVKATDDFAVDDGVTQGLFGGIVGRRDVGMIPEGQETVPMFEEATAQALGVGEGGVSGQQGIPLLVELLSLTVKGRRGQGRPLVTQVDGLIPHGL